MHQGSASVFPSTMNCFKLVVALLASASLLAAAAHPSANRICELTREDHYQLLNLIGDGDNENAVEGWFGADQVVYSTEVQVLLEEMAARDKPACFESLISRLHCRNIGERGLVFSRFLRSTIDRRQVACADAILGEHFVFNRRDDEALWSTRFTGANYLVWDLDDAKRLLHNHQDRIADLAPTMQDILNVHDDEQAIFIIELARHMRNAYGLQSVDPQAMLQFLLWQKEISDEVMAWLITRLKQEGATSDDRVLLLLDHFNPEKHLTRAALLAELEEVKEPGCD